MSTDNVMSSGLEKLKDAVNGGPAGAKLEDLRTVTKDAHDPHARITTEFGAPVTNVDDWLKASTDEKTGPMLLEDHMARERITRFDHERIPERVVHARGSGAFGTFRLHTSLEKYTTAKVLTDTSAETPVFERFSTVLGSRGSADTVRDVRGFAVKFYTPEGNWDIVGNNIPVFFVQDALKFVDIIHAGKPEPHNEIPQAQSAHNNFHDFVYLHTEATHMLMWAMSDRTIPRSFRMMQGFGVNAFKLVNAHGESFLCKFHFTPQLGVHSFVWDEALKLAGQDPDFHRKDLWDAIDNGMFPKWDFGVQVIPEQDQDNFDFDPLDSTKVWPEDLIPIEYVGVMELNRNPDEFFTQTEQVAFCTGHMPPGIQHSDDPLLQGRSFSYQDTQTSRFSSVNWQELPINRPICPVMNQNRDGAMRHTITKGKVNYWPNRFEATPPHTVENKGWQEHPQKVEGIKQRLRGKKFGEHFSQAQLFYNSLSDPEKAHVQAAFAFELDHCDDPVVYERMAQRIADIDLSLAQAVADLVGAPIPEKATRPNHGKEARGLSQTEYAPKEPTVESRRVAIIIADGYDAIAYNGIVSALKAARAMPFTIGPRRNPIYAAGEDRLTAEGVKPDHHLEGMRSTMFDSIFVPGGAESVDTLRKNGRALHWVREAFAHLKAIGATGEAVEFIRDACQVQGMTFSASAEVEDCYGVVTAGQIKPESFRETVKMVKGATEFVDAYLWNISQHKNFEREMKGFPLMVAY